MSSTRNHDNELFEILKECKTLPNFLDEIFGFLHRRTDFYHVAEEKNAAVGLAEGVAESIVKNMFLKWKHKTNLPVLSELDVPAAVEEIIPYEETAVETHTKTEETDMDFTESEYYNGSRQGSYCWSQSITDIDIIVKIPEDATKKDLKVEISTDKICVQTKNDEYLLNGEFCHKCKANDAIWSIDKQKLNIHLDKCQEIWWDCLVNSEERLDLSKIDCSRPYEELPEDAQAKLEELQWNHERKMLGLPTSDELAMQATLKKAWDAEGSPFSGPFDPSTVSFS